MILRWLKSKFKRPSDPIIVNTVDNDYIKDFLIEWSLRYPVDRWWRRKHKVAFNSPSHRDMSFVDMRFEFEEEMMLRKMGKEFSYVPNIGSWIDIDTIINEDADLTDQERIEKYKQEFKNIDLDQYKLD